ncbi:MAG: PLP-dependent transferase [Bacteroidales bacterium]
MKKLNSHKTPIYRDSGFFFENADSTVNAFKAENENLHEPDRYIYSRYRNPTVVAIEKQLAKTEESNWSLLLQSGMAAIDVALSIFQEADNNRPWLFFTEIYGGTNTFINSVLIKRRGINIKRFAPGPENYNLQDFIEVLDKENPSLIYFETISNPMLIVPDVISIIHEAKKRNIYILVDNTFATPYLWKPLQEEADLVIHSATKYLSGHGNISAGVLSGNDTQLMQKAIEYRKWVGHMISPDDAYRLGSQLLTFELRYKKQLENAQKLAEFLENHYNVNKVLYPGLKSHPSYKNAVKIFNNKGFGAIITFQLDGEDDYMKRERSKIFIEKISRYFYLIPSLGDAETIFLPVDAVWGEKYPDPATIRLSVGIEDYSYIEEILNFALDF